MRNVWLTVTTAVFAMALLFATLANGNYATAQTTDIPTSTPTVEQPDGSGIENLPPIEGKLNPPKYPNMDSSLNRIVEQAQSGQSTAKTAAANAPVSSGESVAVTLYITEGYADAIAAYLGDNGGDPRNIGIDYIEAYIPVSLLPAASQQEGVISVRTIVPPQPAQGTVVSEGAAAHGAPAWHAAGLKGQGVKIGVIDTGFEGFRSLMGSELPAAGSVQALCYTDIGTLGSDVNSCLDASGSNHGSAVTEALFDIAPDAEYFISNPGSFGDLQTAVQWMIAENVDVINHSVGWHWDGPGDGTSPFSDSPLRTVDTAVAGGIVWANAAGNGAQLSWFGPFEDSDGNTWHNFNARTDCNTINVRAGERITILLRWDDNWLGASRDLDLFVAALDSNGNLILEDAITSEFEQSGRFGDYPFEIIQTFATNDLTACVAVKQFRGAAPAWMHLASFSRQTLEFHTLAGGIANPSESANPGLLAVGAAPWSNIHAVEPYSDQGPTPDGRTKPDIVGADLGQSVTYRSANNPNGYFSGTSQASPHVAGLAALVKQRFPEKNPQQVAEYLKDHAERRGAVPNNTWGYGFAKLPASDAPQPTPTSTPQTPEPTTTPTATLTPVPGQPTATPEPTPTEVPAETPAPTHTPVPTATPVSTPTVPTEVLNRISALETLVATLQGLISTLEGSISTLNSNVSALASRVAALEADASIPTPVPTPTTVPGETPVPTPTTVPGETPVPTPTQTPVADSCLTSIPSDGAANGSWNSACTTDRNLITARAPVGTRYAGYYTLALSQQSEVTITLESSEDTYLFLLEGADRNGSVIEQNDDIDTDAQNYNSRIVETLAAGDYTILATTYNLTTTGNFTLTVSGIR